MMLGRPTIQAPDEDDLYSGFGNEEVAPALQTDDLEFDEGFQVSVFTILNHPIKSLCCHGLFRPRLIKSCVLKWFGLGKSAV
jgi:hypothetical protein